MGRNLANPGEGRSHATQTVVGSVTTPAAAASSDLPVERHASEERRRPRRTRAEDREPFSDRALASLHRRLSFAGSWRYRTDAIWTRFGVECPSDVGWITDASAQLAFDLAESLRTRQKISFPGRIHKAAFSAPVRLPQHPRYLGYWYDEAKHVLIGMHLRLDINRFDNRYYIVECNTHSGMKPERRELYPDAFDPIIAELIVIAKRFGFERVVLHRARAWSKSYLDEIERASRRTGVDFIGASLPFVHETKRPIVSLPNPLQPKTIYVGNWSQGTPISIFMHDKARFGQWLEETLEQEGRSVAKLACIPTFDRPVVLRQPNEPCWPNLVFKLANSEGGKFVAMGRFESDDHARRALGLGGDPRAVPRCFRRGILRRSFHAPEVVYQPFIPPDVIDRRPRLIRVHVFVSPLVDTFLSAHGVVASKDLPDELPFGLVKDRAPYVVNFADGGKFTRLEPDIEKELHSVSSEFARLAKLAIKRKFYVNDLSEVACP